MVFHIVGYILLFHYQDIIVSILNLTTGDALWEIKIKKLPKLLRSRSLCVLIATCSQDYIHKDILCDRDITYFSIVLLLTIYWLQDQRFHRA